MLRLDQHIKRLLREHECVVVPGLGAFIVHYEGATICTQTGVITPPRREVGLNPALTHNDGLLAGSVARREGVSYDAAMAMIAGEVAAMRSRLEEDGKAEVDGVGTLIRPEGLGQTPTFIPVADGFFNGAYNMLQSVALPMPAEVLPDDAPLRVRGGKSRRGMFVPWGKVAASVAAVMLLGAALFTGISETASRTADTASLMPSRRLSVIESVKPTSSPATENAAVKESAEIKIVEPNDPSASVRLPDRVLEVPSDARRFYLIIASLPTYARAQAYISAHNGKKHMAIIRSGQSRYRICMAISSTFEGALAHKRFFNAYYPDSWIAWDE